jgi:hypothetical protein
VRAYHRQTELVDAAGEHIRFLPAAMAKAMVDAGHAEIANANGKVRSIRLITATSSHARRIGPPTATTGPETVRFTRKAKLDFPAVLWEHHPRCWHYREEP